MLSLIYSLFLDVSLNSHTLTFKFGIFGVWTKYLKICDEPEKLHENKSSLCELIYPKVSKIIPQVIIELKFFFKYALKR